MRRVLIVTTAYAPTMIADMQRTRHLAWELPKLGWEVEILCPATEYQPATCVDDDSNGFFPPDTLVHYVEETAPSLFRMARVGGISWRALLPLWIRGTRLLRERPFDVVYLSTAHFPLFVLGRMWQRRSGVPYVIDLHDPVFKEDSTYPTWARPGLKHRLSRAFSRHVEVHVIAKAQGLIAVSPHYIETMRRRHEARQPAWLYTGRSEAIPFSARPGDLLEASRGLRPATAKSAPAVRIVYVGVGGAVMKRSFALFCRALAHLRARLPELCWSVRIELFGTMLGWRTGEPRELAELAAKHGLGDLVEESPGRISYRRSLELLLQSDGALILGVEDAAYMPSKLFSYALSGRPLLAVLHRDGPAFAQFERFPNLGRALWFTANEEMQLDDAAAALQRFLQESAERQVFDRRTSLAPYLAPAMALRHIGVFDACLSDFSHVKEAVAS